MTPPNEDGASINDDWWGLFHLRAFLSLTQADRNIERRELVWVKRFLAERDRGDLIPLLEEEVAAGQVPHEELSRFLAEARERLSTSEKRQFIYNLAQLCKSKGAISTDEYEHVLDMATSLGLQDTDADSIVNSVFSIDETLRVIMGLLALGVALYYTQAVIVPLVIALFLSMIVGQVEGRVSAALGLRKTGMRWINKVLATVLILSGLFALILAAVVSGKDIASRIPFYQAKVNTVLKTVEELAAAHGFEALDKTGIVDQLSQIPVGNILGGLFSSLLGIVGNFLLIVVFTGFLVAGGSGYQGILLEMNEKISAYNSIKALLSLVTGVGVYLLCYFFQVDFSLFWALLGFMLNFIPSVGSTIASLPPVILSAVQHESWSTALFFGGSMVSMHMVLGQVLEPKLMGDRLAIKPLAILMGLIFWGFLWGIPGMFLAAPLMALLRTLASYFNFSRGFERLLAAGNG